jgi:hypothetical protein
LDGAAHEERLAEIEERVDFLERRLSEPLESRRIKPSVTTPV